MADVILYTKSENLAEEIKELLEYSRHNIFVSDNTDNCMKKLYSEDIDGVIIDSDSKEDLTNFARKIRVVGKKKQPFVLLSSDSDFQNDLLFKYIDGFIQKDVSKSQKLALLNSAFRISKTVNDLNKSNSELAKNIYQLDVLYNTSSSFASTLNKKKLIEMMIQSIQRSLSPTFMSVFIKETNTLYLTSNRKPTYRLEDALKLRAILNFKDIYPNEEIDLNNLVIERNFTEEFSELDLQLFNYDNISSLITLSDKNYGFLEVFKEADFSQEDLTCLQSVLKQVSSPLENAILYQEIKDTNTKLEKLERMKSDFISIVSHELRTPLTPIKNSLDIILKGMAGEITPQTTKFIEMAKRNVDRLSDIINDLLDLSKVEAGKMDFKFEKKSVIPVLEYVKTNFEQTAKNKNITISFDKEKEIPDLYIDSKRIEQIITNIISNAIKFTPENGEVKINCDIIPNSYLSSIDFYEQNYNEEFENYVKISIQDTGIGIKKEDIPKIFDKFRQVENSLSREVGGTGLGLPIAKQLTNAHQGVIWLDSEPEKGSCFSVAIPVMNDFQIFKTELNRSICNAKQLKKTITLIKIKEDKDIISNAIKDEKLSIFKNTSEYNSVWIKENGKNSYICFSQDIDEYALNFIIKKFESFIKSNVQESEQNGIMFSTAVYPNDGLNADILLDKLEKELKFLGS